MAEQRDIKYINRDFSDFRAQLIEYAKNYFPNTYNDFSPTSPGMMFIEMAAYVGDVLSFYQDTQLQETFLTHAKDPKNLYSLAYMLGYRPKTTGASEVELEITQRVGVDGNFKPNWNQAASIGENAVYTSTDSSQTKFIVTDRVDFTFSSSYDPTEITISKLDSNNDPEEYQLKKRVKAVSGEILTTTFSIGQSEKFKTLTVEDTNIIGVLDITGSSSETDLWYEVPFLAQDTVFESISNSSASDSDLVPFALSIKKAPKRYTTRHLSNGHLQIQFGSGTNSDLDDTEILPDPTNVGLGSDPLTSKLNKAYDPKNFLYSKSYGIAPSNTVLRVRYLKGGGVTSNIPANTLTVASSQNTITSAGGDNSRLSSTYLTYTNPKPASGGREGDSVDELRENSLRAFNEQSRTVTLQDYAVRVMSLPPKYGSVAKVYVTQSELTNTRVNEYPTSSNPFAIDLYVLAFDYNRKLITATQSLKSNIKKYLSEYIMITDAINIKDAFVVNIGVTYDILIRPNYSGRDVLLNCNKVLKDYFNISKRSINQPINLSDIYRQLDKVPGVQTVQNVSITNKNRYQHGNNYSEHAYDIPGAILNNIVYPSYDPCIFEVKYPEQDIKGRITTL